MPTLELSSTPLFSDASLVAYYKLENVNDSKASYTLTNNNTVTFTSAKFNNGANLGTANTNKYLSRADALGLTSGGAKTISCWVKMNTELSGADSYGGLISLVFADVDAAFTIGYWRASSVNKVVFVRNKNAIGTTEVGYAANMGTSVYHLLVLVWDGSSTVTGYYDGVSIGSGTFSGNGNNGFSDKFVIGTSSDVVNFSSATVDDVAVFSRVLTNNEVLSLYTGDWITDGSSPMFFDSVAIG